MESTTRFTRRSSIATVNQGLDLLITLLFGNEAHALKRRGSSLRDIDPSSSLSKGFLKDKEIENFLELHILTQSLHNVLLEPDKILKDEHDVNEQLSMLITRHFPDIVDSFESRIQISQNFASISLLLTEISQQLERINQATGVFSEQQTGLFEQRNKGNRLVNCFGKLSDFINLPFLVESLVKNGNYDEAIDLFVFSQKTAARYPQIQLVQDLFGLVKDQVQQMKTQLLDILSAESNLSLFIRVVGYLRKLDIFSESELRITFLKFRKEYMQGLLASLDGLDDFEYLKKYIEVCRENFFDLITQYRAIFGENTPSMYSQDDSLFGSSDGLSYILSSFTSNLEKEFASTVKARIGSIQDLTNLNSVYTLCMYFGMSLGRVGMDLRFSISPLFEQATLILVSKTLNEVQSSFEASVQNEGVGFFASTNLGTDDDVVPEYGMGTYTIIQPPSSLLNYRGLAILHNLVFSVFQKMRPLCFVSIVAQVEAQVKSFLEGIRTVVSDLASVKMGDRDAKLVADVLGALDSVFGPSIVSAFQTGLYPDVYRGAVARRTSATARHRPSIAV